METPLSSVHAVGRVVYRALIACIALLVVAPTASAHADTLLVPVGGHPVRFGPDRVVCPGQALEEGWTVDPDARGVHSPAGDSSTGHAVTLTVASDFARCAGSRATVTLIGIGPRPSVDASSITLDVDSALVSVRGRGLRGMEMRWWAPGGATGGDRCTEPTTDNGVDACVLAVGHGLPLDAQTVALSFMAPGARMGSDVVEYDAQGRTLQPPAVDIHPSRVHIARLLPPDAAIDVQGGAARVTLLHPDAVSQVDCDAATCDLDGDALTVRDVRSADATLSVRFRLRPHVFLRRGTGFVADPLVDVALQHCPVSFASPQPLRGVSDQSVVLRIAGRCAHDADLRFSSSGSVASIERTETVGDEMFAVVRPTRFDTSEVAITIERNGTVVGIARSATRAVATIHSRLELRGRGDIDFIPTNRPVRVLPPASAGLRLTVIPVDGIYTVAHDTDGADTVRGVAGAAGAVALRFAWRDPSLPPALRDLDLATLNEPVDRTIKQANLPIALGAAIHGVRPLIELLCSPDAGHTIHVAAGDTVSIPYRAHDSCRLVIHREQLDPQDGSQNLRIAVEMYAFDGTPRRESTTDAPTVVVPGSHPQFVYISGVAAAFDRAIIRVSLASDPGFYATAPDERTTGPQAQWSVIFGNDHFRFYGTFAVPTGLFRLSDPNDSGNLTISAGILFRLVPLTREGQEFAVALESGILWMGFFNALITSDPRLGNLGGPAAVLGVGIGLPIANAGRVAQASLSLHLWAVCDIWRPVLRAGSPAEASGTPFGFVFGPSISVGNIGRNF